MNRYPPRNIIRVDVEFKDTLTGALVDPGVASVEVIDPNGLKTVLSPATKVVDGKYFAMTYCVVEGKWQYAGVGTGTNIGASEGAFVISPSGFSP